jgi:hypothetical protein
MKGLVKEWYDRRTEGDLNKAVIDREMQAMESKLAKYNLEQLGEIPIKREECRFWYVKWEDVQAKKSDR